MKKKKFRFQSQWLHLTFKTHVDVEGVRGFITSKSKQDCKFKIAHETGDEHHPYLHTHILIYFPKKFETISERKFDFNKIHPSWKKIQTGEHWTNCYNYLDKENCVYNDVDIGCYPLNNGFSHNLIEKIQKHDRFQSVINDSTISYEISNKMSWAKCVWNARPRLNLTEGLVLNSNQVNWLDKLNKQDDRKVLWIYDRKGGSGKSTLTNWLIDNKGAFMCNGGKLSDIAYAYDYEEIVIFDLPRTSEEFTPYRAIECFKDGRLFSAKYESKMKRFKSAKVIVFANFKPIKESLSLDRWEVLKLPYSLGGSLNIRGNP